MTMPDTSAGAVAEWLRYALSKDDTGESLKDACELMPALVSERDALAADLARVTKERDEARHIVGIAVELTKCDNGRSQWWGHRRTKGQREEWRCGACGQTATGESFHVGHVMCPAMRLDAAVHDYLATPTPPDTFR